MRIINNRKKCIAILITLVLVVLYIVRVVYVNVTANHIPIDTYGIGDTFEYEDFRYCVKSFDILDKEQMEQRYNTELAEEGAKYIISEIDVKYIGEESTAPCTMYEYSFQSGSWHNGQNFFIYSDINKDSTMFNTNDEKTMVAVCPLKKAQFSSREWKNVTNRKFELVVSTYPREIIVKFD